MYRLVIDVWTLKAIIGYVKLRKDCGLKRN
jgi:hypothetical protein